MATDTQGYEIRWIASATVRGKTVNTAPYDTREKAAADIFAVFPRVATCYTSREWNGAPTGSAMQFHDRSRD